MKIQTIYFLLVLMVSATTNSAIAQISFQKTYGGTGNEFLQKIQTTADGGFLLVGETYSFGAGINDVYIVKTDADGTMEWNTVLGGNIAEFTTDFIETLDGGYAILGSTFSWIEPMSEELMLIKIDNEGNLEWTRAVGGEDSERGYSLKQSSDGGFIIGGLSNSYSAGGYDFFIVKLDEVGVTEWATRVGFSGNDICRGIFETELGDYLAFGQGGPLIGASSIMVSRIDIDGNVLWTKTMQSVDRNVDVYSVIETTDNKYVLTGWENDGIDKHNFLAIKLDTAANILWSKSYGGEENVEFSYGVMQSSDGGFILSGDTKSFAVGGTKDAYLVKISEDGLHEWSKTYGYAGEETAISVLENEDGTLAVAGNENSNGSGGTDMWLYQVGEDGYMPCVDALDPTAIVVSDPETIVSDIVFASSVVEATEFLLWNSIPLTPSITTGGTETVICIDSTLSVEDYTLVDFNVYPNPANSIIRFSLLQDQNTIIQLVDIQGKDIPYTMNQFQDYVELETLYKGFAILIINQENRQAISKSVVFR